MKFKASDIRSILCDDLEEDSPFKIVEEGDWVSEGKYETQSIIFSFENKFFEAWNSRSGSYHSDYFYEFEDWKDDDEIECIECEKVEVVKHEWKAVK